MMENALARSRRRVGLGLSVLSVSWVIWMLTPGVPVLWAPRADPSVRQAGLALFEHEWAPGDSLAAGDGLGPVYNERSCVACHFQGGVGGGGAAKQNVASFEALPGPGRSDVQGGVVHTFAVSKECRESPAGLHDFFPVVKGGLKIVGGCTIVTHDFDPVRVQAVNPTALFGAGWVDRISGKSIVHQSRQRSWQAIGKEVVGADLGAAGPGRPRVLPDGRIGKFGWKAQFATLQEFVAAACANELGLGNPMMDQAKPWTRGTYAKVNADLDATQFRALVGFCDTLPRPVEILPDDPRGRAQAERGKVLFGQIGCASCHTPDLGGVSGVYSDFLLHRVVDTSRLPSGYSEVPPIPLPEDYPLPDEWKTPPLWGVADSAPYFHDGASPTLDVAIRRHKGDAESVTRSFESLDSGERAAIIGFLKSLKAPAEAEPAEVKPADPRSRGIIAMTR
jgi:mono/diheme cytochrome c family protein